MDRLRTALPAVLAMALAVGPGVVAAAGPGATDPGATPSGGAWGSTPIEPLAAFDNDGGFAIADDQHATVIARSGDGVWAMRTATAGATWTTPVRISPTGWDVFATGVSQRGNHVDMVSAAMQGDTRRLLVRHSGDGGVTFAPAVRLAGWGYEPVIARGANGLVIVSAAPDPDVHVRISRNGGASFGGPLRIGGYKAGCCVYEPGRTAIAISGKVVLVLHWRSSHKLVLHRSANGGRDWAAPIVFSTRIQGTGIDLAVKGSTVVAAFTSGRLVVTRRSTDRGATWSAPVTFRGTGDLSLEHDGDRWAIAYERADGLRYRSSAGGRSWSPEALIATMPRWDEARPLGVGRLGGVPVVPWVHYREASEDEVLEWASRP